MARKEKISEERKKLIQEFIKSNDLKTAGDIQEAIKELFKDTIQEMLNAELTEHLGYEKNEYTEDNENYRNGYSQKTVHSTEGDITLNVPRDRQGTFDPIVVEKGQKDISSIEEKIIKMYARGFSNQNIYEEMQELYGVKVSPDMVTAITDKIIPEIREWQKRQLEEQYAIVFVDATYFNVKQDGIVVKKAVYIALGVTMTGEKEILGFYIGDSESAKYWTNILNEIKNRGVKDILIKFKYIKALMLNGEEETRNDGVMLFTKTAFLYSAEEQKEFADMLNANELDYIMQIAKQERTIIDKVVTKSKMFEFVKAKMKQLGDEPR